MVNATPMKPLAMLSDAIAQRMGLYFPPERLQELASRIRAAAKQQGYSSAEQYLHRLLHSTWSRKDIENLAQELTIGETYFFRDQQAFEALAQSVLPELIAARRAQDRHLRMWSAACCTGEEPYSLAILLMQLIPDWKDWNLSIHATDVNPKFLRAAQAGKYGLWSFRDRCTGIREKYFLPAPDGRFELLSEIRESVSFSYLNLVEDLYPPAIKHEKGLDLIFCRNVLMYFAPEQAKKVVCKLHGLLAEGGWLVVSGSETSNTLFADFEAVCFPGAVLYRKTGRTAHRANPDAAPPQTRSLELPDPKVEFVSAVSAAERSPGTAQAQSRPPDTWAEAVRHFEKGEYEDAATKLEQWLAGRPNDVEGLRLLVRAYANRGELGQAHQSCRRALSCAPLDPALHYLLATVLEEQGALEAAAASLRQALYLDPDFAVALFALSNIRARQGRLAEASRHRRNALRALSALADAEVVPQAEGITVARLAELIRRSEVIAP